MGLRPTPLCTRCKRDHGDLIHLLWRCPKLHPYWKGVVDTINRVFQVLLPTDPKRCLLLILEELEWEEGTKVAVIRSLFLARKLIMSHWIAEEPPSLKEWINIMGEMLRKEKVIYQHRGCSLKFEKLWGRWLDVPGMAPVDLVTGRLLGLSNPT